MQPAAQALAAIEILTDMEARPRPAANAVKDWGLSHRFAGSRDRAAIASIVYDVMRKRASLGWAMGTDTPRALVIGTFGITRGQGAEAIDAGFTATPHAPDALTVDERKRLESPSLEGAPAWVVGDYPEWLDGHFTRVFGDDRGAELAAQAQRAPLDLRSNALKGSRDKALTGLKHLGAEATPISPYGLRVPLLSDGRGPPVQSEPIFLKGLVEVQDEGSQLAALIAGAAPGEQVVDFCAGAGGKTLAMAAGMANKGQIYAHDNDVRRLAPLHDRATRAGVRNVQMRAPKGEADVMGDMVGRANLVLVDAPCTGTGTWRRNPDAKWRLRENALEQRQDEQNAVLRDAARLVKPGGRLVYITCSALSEENEDRIEAFLANSAGFSLTDPLEAAIRVGLPQLGAYKNAAGNALLLSPRRSGTDGFFIAILKREG